MLESPTVLETPVPGIDPREQKSRLLIYCAGFVAVQFGCVMLSLMLASTPWFLTHDDYPGMTQAGYELRLKHQDCDVVIYGDSSALTGLDPEVVQKISGLKTCNISEGSTIQSVVGSSFPLDAYLKNNKRPRFILMMFTPSIYRPYRKFFDEYQPEGLMYALQYDRSSKLYWALLRRPNWAAMFAIWAGHAMINDLLRHHLSLNPSRESDTPRGQRARRNGIWPYPFPPETECTRKAFDPALISRNAESVAEVKKRYGVDGTKVIVNISPVPTCDVMAESYRERSEGLHDNAFERLPISYFNEGDVHFSARGSEYISTKAGSQILMLEQAEKSRLNQANGPVKGGNDFQ